MKSSPSLHQIKASTSHTPSLSSHRIKNSGDITENTIQIFLLPCVRIPIVSKHITTLLLSTFRLSLRLPLKIRILP